MDPEQTLRDAAAALDAGQWRDAIDRLRDYAAWRRGGGYEPTDGDVRAERLGRRARRLRRLQQQQPGPDGNQKNQADENNPAPEA